MGNKVNDIKKEVVFYSKLMDQKVCFCMLRCSCVFPLRMK